MSDRPDATLFGSFLSGSGDVNSDGFDDVFACRSFDTSTGGLYLGSASGLVTPTAGVHAQAQGPCEIVSGGGDVDGDGYDDVITGRDSGSAATKALLLYGGPNSAPVADAQAVTASWETPTSVTLTGAEPDGEPVTYAVEPLVGDATIDAQTGEFRWGPDEASVGMHQLTLSADDGALQATRQIAIVVSTSTPTADAGREVGLDAGVDASDAAGDASEPGDSDAAGDAGGDPPPTGGESGEGCACTSMPTGPSGAAAVLVGVLGLVGMRRSNSLPHLLMRLLERLEAALNSLIRR